MAEGAFKLLEIRGRIKICKESDRSNSIATRKGDFMIWQKCSEPTCKDWIGMQENPRKAGRPLEDCEMFG